MKESVVRPYARSEYYQQRTLHELFFDQVERTPDRVAIRTLEEELSYRELADRCLQLMNYLKTYGIKRQSRIAIFLPRTQNLPIALWSVLTCGAIYVPIDPNAPSHRIRLILEDSEPVLILTDSTIVQDLPESGIKTLCIDSSNFSSDELGVNAPKLSENDAADPNDLAYIVYSSGSTGTPKGIGVEHYNKCSFVRWMHSEYSEADFARNLCSTSVSFDMFLYEFYGTLTGGGCLELIQNALELPNWPGYKDLTMLNTVPSVLNELMSMIDLPESVRAINLGGEALQGKLVERIFKQLPNVRLYNLYGPCEDTTASTFDLIRAENPIPTIGNSIPGRTAYLLDSNLKPVADGEIGELFLGGDGVTRGYWRQDELTKTAFLPNPFDSGSRKLYRTGDLARYLPSGKLHYQGRADEQIKRHGVRINIGEIDEVIKKNRKVLDVKTVVHEQNNETSVYTFFSPSKSDNTSARNLNDVSGGLENCVMDWAKGELPYALIPTRCIQVDSFPKLVSGKIDMVALRNIISTLEFTKKREPICSVAEEKQPDLCEQKLIGLWKQCISHQDIRRNSKFFNLGGHSLQMAKLGSLIYTEFKVEIPLSQLLQSDQLSQQAELISEKLPSSVQSVTPTDRDATHLLCSFAQRRYWILDQLIPGSPRYNVVLPYRLRGKLKYSALENAVRAVQARHRILRSTYEMVDGELLQIVGAVNDSVYEEQNFSQQDFFAAELDALKGAEEMAREPFDLSTQSPLRVGCFAITNDEHILLIVTHHIAIDGSQRLLAEELSSLYAQFSKTDSLTHFNELTFQYADFAAWQNQFLDDDRVDRHLRYWRDKLPDDPKQVSLPTDRSLPLSETGMGALYRFDIPNNLKKAQAEYCQSVDTTQFCFFLALSWLFFARLSEMDDVSLAVPMTDRPHPELHGKLGNFVNTVIMRCQVSRTTSFEELKNFAETYTREAHAHSELPFDVLVDKLSFPRSNLNSPLTNIMVSILNENYPIDFPGIVADNFMIDLCSSRFDLSFFVDARDSNLSGVIEYRSDLFDPATIESMAQSWLVLMDVCLREPTKTISPADFLAPKGRDFLITECNSTTVNYSESIQLHSAFEKQVLKAPEAIAIVGDQFTLRYAALDQAANRIANALIADGIQLGDKVGIWCDRGQALIPALFGVLKAGGCYVPMDSTTPIARAIRCVEIAEIQIVLSDSSMKERSELLDIPVLNCDRIIQSTTISSSRPDRVASPESLAYIIFTSGSTGEPKAVAVNHKAAVNLLEWVNSTFTITSEDRLLFVTSVAFDLSVYDVFGILSTGASLYLANNEQVRDPKALSQLLENGEISFWDSAPAALSQCVPYIKDTSRTALRLVFLSGDWIPVNFAKQLKSLFPQTQLVALGGATEATIWSNYHLIDRDDFTRVSIPYGRPIQNAKYYVLDSNRRPVPPLFAGGFVYRRGGTRPGILCSSGFDERAIC